MINKFIKKYWPLFIIFLLSLFSLVWFRKNYLVAGGDISIYLDPSANIYNYSFAWFDKINSGMPSLEIAKLFPFSSFWLAGKALGISIENTQRFWVILHFILGGLFMYLLINFLFRPSGNRGKVAGLVGAVYYMFNFLVIVDAIQPVLRPVVTFLPLMMYLFIRGINEEKLSVALKYASFFALASLLFASSNLNLANVVPIYIISLVYWIYFLVSTRKIKRGLIFGLIIIGFFLLVNCWWLVNLYFSAVKASEGLVGDVRSYDFLKSTPIYEAFRTMGFWAFLQQFNGQTLLPYAMSYYRFPLIFLTFLIPIMGFSALLFKEKAKSKIFFCFLALLGIFLAKGSNHPFGFFYQFLYDKITFFAVFREPFIKFTLIHVFAFSVLLGFFAEDLIDFQQEKKKKNLQWLVLFFIILTILVNSYPLLTGKNIQDETWYNDSRYSLYVKVPDYWKQAGEWFKNNNSTSKVLLFPQTFYGHTYNWESGISSGAPVAMYFLPNPVIYKPTQAINLQNSISQIVYQLLYLGEKADLSPYLDLFAVNYVLQQNDVTANNEAGILDPFIMAKILKEQKKLSPIVNFGSLNVFSKESTNPVGSIPALEVYEVKRDISSLQVYIPSSIVLVQGDEKSYPDIFSFYQHIQGNGYLFFDDSKKIKETLDKIKQDKKLLINLKKTPVRINNDKTIFDFQVPKSGNYLLLINEYLFNSDFNKEKKEYFVVVNEHKLTIPVTNSSSWRKINLNELLEGSNYLETNLPVGEIKGDFLTSPFWVIEAQNYNENNFQVEIPRLSFHKINPSEYEVAINGAVSPFFLFLSETHHPEWKLFYNNKELKTDHLVANGYANGWYIDSNRFDQKDFKIKAKYQPQTFLNIGIALSLGTISLLIIYNLIILIKKK